MTQNRSHLFTKISKKFSEGTCRTITMGDMNVHEVEWLIVSNRSSLEVSELHTLSNIAGLSERVGKPTRGDNLLDLVLNDLGAELTCEVKPGISDHESVLGTVKFKIIELLETEREFFDYRNAPWHLLNREFDVYNWEAKTSTLLCIPVQVRLMTHFC